MLLDAALHNALEVLHDLTVKRLIERFALIGGLAVSTLGIPRATEDIDFLLALPQDDATAPRRLTDALTQGGHSADLRRGDPEDPIQAPITTAVKGVAVDLLVAAHGFERDAVGRAITIRFEGKRLPVVAPEDLIILKLKAGGPRDLADVHDLLEVATINWTALLALAREQGVQEQLASLLRP